jgi:copper resistance protein C
MLTRFLVPGGLAAAALLLGLAAAGPAAAHAELQASEPADGAVLQSPPARLALTFAAPVQITALRLLDAAGTEHPLAREGARRAPVSALSATIPHPLPPGAYRVEYRGVSPDGHVGGGALGFSVATPAR